MVPSRGPMVLAALVSFAGLASALVVPAANTRGHHEHEKLEKLDASGSFGEAGALQSREHIAREAALSLRMDGADARGRDHLGLRLAQSGVVKSASEDAEATPDEDAEVSLGARSRSTAKSNEAHSLTYQEALDEAAEKRAEQERKMAEEAAMKAQVADVDSMLASMQDDEGNSTQSGGRKHVLKFGFTKARPCPEEEDCMVHTMTNQRGNMNKEIITQLNRGGLGHHMFQWAAAISVAKELKERAFRLVLSEDNYTTFGTVQMHVLRPVAWSPADYSFLQQQQRKCHVWDKLPLVIDSGLSEFSQRTALGAQKGKRHTPGDYETPDDGNLARAVAQAISRTQTPMKCHIWELDGLFLNQGFFRHHISMVRLVFWDEAIVRKAEDTLRWLLWNEVGSAVGIHIRFGDKDFTGRNLQLSYYSEALRQVKAHVGDDPLVCVIFSDDMGEAMRRSKSFDLCSVRIPMTPAISDQKTFYMMSLLPNLIIADSVFSFWAARVSPNDPFVVAPEITDAPSRLLQDYEYLTQTPGWTTVMAKLGPVGPSARLQFNKEVETQKDLPSGFLKLGPGYCRNGYYTGHVAADAADLKTCAAKCNEEQDCMFFAFQEGKTCSRYNSNAGECELSDRGQDTHVTFGKMSDSNVAMRHLTSLEARARHVMISSGSAEELTLEEISQLEGYTAPTSEWAF